MGRLKEVETTDDDLQEFWLYTVMLNFNEVVVNNYPWFTLLSPEAKAILVTKLEEANDDFV